MDRPTQVGLLHCGAADLFFAMRPYISPFPCKQAHPAMTTIVAVRKGNQIAIAADSQTTFGDDQKLLAGYDCFHDKIFRMATVILPFPVLPPTTWYCKVL
jgi:hypothetical protein